MPQVSVIIPNYNHAAYLDMRINSILNQTFQDFELIILDDKSPDNSKEVIEKYRHSHHVSQIVYNEENSGSTFNQWKKGIGMAKGEYIWIAESDDWCEPTLLETLINGLMANLNAGIAFCQSVYFYEPNNIKSRTYYPFFENCENGTTFIKNYMLKGNSIVNASMAVWKKSLYTTIDNEYTSFKFCGDWLFYISILQQSDIFVSGKVLNYFRNHTKDVSTKFFGTGNNYIENVRVYEILLSRRVITENEFIKLVKMQYNMFIESKPAIDVNNFDRIDASFSKYLNLNPLKKLYYRLRLKLYFLKAGFMKTAL